VQIVDAEGTASGSVELPADLFDAQVNIPLIHQVVVGQLAAARQGTHATKTRGEVSGGGRKPYRQKGTGRARQGSIRAPQFTGGGIVHGPTPHTYEQRTPKRMKAAALRGALSDRARDGRIHIVESFVGGDKPSTKSAFGVLARLTDRRRPLVVLERSDELTVLSLRNVARVHVLYVDQLNTYDVLASDDVIFTRGAYDAFVAARSTGASDAGATGGAGAADADATVVAAAEVAETPDAETPDIETPDIETPDAEATEIEADDVPGEEASAEAELEQQNEELTAVAKQASQDEELTAVAKQASQDEEAER
jgi:large subunit ribosomal protein L4